MYVGVRERKRERELCRHHNNITEMIRGRC